MTDDRREYWRSVSKARKVAGKCKSCGNMAVPGKTRCQECRDRERVQMHARYAARKAKDKAVTAPEPEPPADESCSCCGCCAGAPGGQGQEMGLVPVVEAVQEQAVPVPETVSIAINPIPDVPVELSDTVKPEEPQP